MSKPLRLSVHKSQIERSRRKSVRSEMIRQAGGMSSDSDIVAYAIVGLTSDGQIRAGWDTGGAVPLWAFPATICEALAQDIATSGTEEDFRKPVVDRAWKGSK